MLAVHDLPVGALAKLFAPYGLKIEHVASGADIPGSYWDESEAGLIGDRLFVSDATPVHSVLHEACHFICMDSERRSQLHRDAGGDHAEENAVCYLQILLADHVASMDRDRMLSDMDAWGYTFRLGSSRAWFEKDAADAREWLRAHGVIDASEAVTWRMRT